MRAGQRENRTMSGLVNFYQEKKIDYNSPNVLFPVSYMLHSIIFFLEYSIIQDNYNELY